jgi:uncharacterized protein
MVEPQAFRKSEQDGFPGLVCRFEHRDPLGTIFARTLEIQVNQQGVDYTVTLADTSAGNDIWALTTRGDLPGSSFSFQCYDEQWSHESGVPIRHLTDARLLDVSPVSIPAYPDSTVSMRTADKLLAAVCPDASVALRSLAMQFDADPDEVLQMARDNQLSKLFVRSDRSRRTMSGREALLETMRLRHPDAPIRRRSGKQAQLETLRQRWPAERRSGRQALLETEAMKED